MSVRCQCCRRDRGRDMERRRGGRGGGGRLPRPCLCRRTISVKWIWLSASRQGLLPPNARLLGSKKEEEEAYGRSKQGEHRVFSSKGGKGDAAIKSFDDFLGLSNDDERLSLILCGLRSVGFVRPMKLQRFALRPLCLTRCDVLLIGPDGIGKTTACLVGLLSNIDSGRPCCQALVLAPTMDQAVATEGSSTIWTIASGADVQTMAFIGAAGTAPAWVSRMAREFHHVIIGAPRRVLDVIEAGTIDVEDIHHLILDDADEILSKGHRDDVYRILRAPPLMVRVVVIVIVASRASFDIDDKTLRLASNVLAQDTMRIAFVSALPKPPSYTLRGVRQFYVDVSRDKWKVKTLQDLLEQFPPYAWAVAYVDGNCRDARAVANAIHILAAEDKRRAARVVLLKSRVVGGAIGGGRMQDDDNDDIQTNKRRESRAAPTRPLVVGAEGKFARHHCFCYAIRSDKERLKSYPLIVNFNCLSSKEEYLIWVGRIKGMPYRVRTVITFVALSDTTTTSMQGDDNGCRGLCNINVLRNMEEFCRSLIKELPSDVADHVPFEIV